MMPTLLLEHQEIQLQLLNQSHIEPLTPLALEPGLFEFTPRLIETSQDAEAYLMRAIRKYAEGSQIPFAIFHKTYKKYLGSTRFYRLDEKNKQVSIGYTWYGEAYRGKGFNQQVKQMMLRHAFESMSRVRVAMNIDARNLASRKAAAKVGFKEEGILRKELRMSDGSYRDTVIFAMTDEDYQKISAS